MRVAGAIAALMILAPAAWAGDVHYHFQPQDYVWRVCGDDRPWGCVWFSAAANNPGDIDCHIRMSVVLRDLPVEREYVEGELLAECAAGP